MSDLISRSALIEYLEKVTVTEGITFETGFKQILTDIKNQPTVEAKPVEWIPCSERLPNCNGCYLVWRPHFFGGQIGMPAICYFDGQDTWHDSYGVDFTRILNEKDVIAWMPLPTPYNAERGGKNE